MPGSKQLPLSSEQSDLQLAGPPKSTEVLSTVETTAGLSTPHLGRNSSIGHIKVYYLHTVGPRIDNHIVGTRKVTTYWPCFCLIQ